MGAVLDRDVPRLESGDGRRVAPHGAAARVVGGEVRALGFVPSNDHPFGPNDWLRGSGNGRYDWKPEDGMGFHIALRRASEVRS